MPTIDYRVNLVTAAFPFISDDVGRTVIIKQQDQNYIPPTSSKADEDKDAGIAQAYYMHNVMPFDSGYQSVSFSKQISAASGDLFKEVLFLVSPLGAKVLIAVLTDGTFQYCSEDTDYTWTPLALPKKAVVTFVQDTPPDPIPDPDYLVEVARLTGVSISSSAAVSSYVIEFTSATEFTVTNSISGAQGTGEIETDFESTDTFLKFFIEPGDYVFVAGDTYTFAITAVTASATAQYSSVYMQGAAYFCISGVGIFEYNFEENTLDWKNVVGLDFENVLGIAAAQGYLLAYSEDAIGWSSLSNAVDFTPSLITGAGGGSVEGARGPIRRVVSSATGLYIFTAQNAVSAVFSQNTRYPFIFTTISNCGGLTDASLATEEAEDSALYAFTTQGLQNISVKQAKTGFTEASDFLTNQLFEDFDTATLSISKQVLTSPLKRKLAFISGRYLVLSYGVDSLTHALIYDGSLKRWGKLKIPHVDVFEYGFFDADTADAAKKQIAFLQSSGAVYTVDFSAGRAAGDSVLMLGRYQVLRSRMTQLTNVSVDGINSADRFDLYTLPTLNGVDFESAVPGYLYEQGSGTREYYFRNTAANHSILLTGKFKLNSMQLTLGVGGGR